MIVADTGAVLALLDADEEFHNQLSATHQADPGAWVLPWAILPEVDYLLQKEAGLAASRAWLADIADGRWSVVWGVEDDLVRANDLNERFASLGLGLVDGVVIAVAERLRAEAIATLDLRHFGAVMIAGSPKLIPRDL